MLIMLAAVAASRGMPDPTQVTGAQIRDSLRKINTRGATVVRTGPDEFAKAVSLLQAGTPINYEGASGPVDFDDNNNIIDRVAHWKVVGGQFVEVEKYDCVGSQSCPLL
jgi:branched-chain amino acid transport system substrate-binding protein